MLQRLAVFAGGFDLAAAEAVCGAEPLDPLDVMDLLASLVEKSLVMLDERERRHALPHAGDAARLRAREAGAGRRGAAPPRRATASTSSRGQAGARRPAGPGAGRLGGAAGDRDSTTCAPRCALALRRRRRPLHGGQAGRWRCRASGCCAATPPKAARSCAPRWRCRRSRPRTCAQAWALYVGAALATGQSDHAEARQMLETCLALRARAWATRWRSRPRCRRWRWRGCRAATRRRRWTANARRCRSFSSSATARARPSATCTWASARPGSADDALARRSPGTRAGPRARDRPAGDRGRVRARTGRTGAAGR